MGIENVSSDGVRLPEGEELLPVHRLETLCFLVQSISHDFHGYLLGIVGNAERVRQTTDRPEHATDSCESIIRNAQDAGRLVKKLQVLARLSLTGPPDGRQLRAVPRPLIDA